MNQSQALSKARKLFGKAAFVRDDGRVTSPELRAKARAELAALRATPPLERGKNFRAEESILVLLSIYYRCAVGHAALGLFFSVEGEGDNWGDALDAAQRKRAP